MIRTLSIVFFFVFVNSGSGQDFSKYFAVVMDVNKPLSNNEFIDALSWRGAKIIYRESINNSFSVGGDFGYATYNDYLPPTVYQTGNTALYAEVYTYVYNYSMTLSGEYYVLKDSWIKPFVGLGVGVSYNRYAGYFNVFVDENKSWGALARPTIGTLLRFGKQSNWAVTTGIHFDFATNKSPDFDYKNFTNAGLQAGMALIIR